MTTVAIQLAWARRQLNEKEHPLLEAQILLAHVLGCERVNIIAWPEKEVTPEQEAQFHQFVVRRIQHEPIAYLVGEKEFWSHAFRVTQDTLIPRPDTERLIEVILEKLPSTPLKVVDVGTGSGIIACILASLRPQWHVVGVDISTRALAIAEQNAKRLNLNNIEWVHSCWLEEVKNRQFDAIISNPPYLRADDEHLEQGDLSFEPLGALVSGRTGLEAFTAIVAQAKYCLKQNGWLLFEHGYDQAKPVQELLAQNQFSDVETFKDLNGLSRVTIGKHCLT